MSNIARCTAQTKLEVLQYLADESVKAHKEVLAVLNDRPEALAAYLAFAKGGVYYHTSTKRYKLAELWEMAAEAEKRECTDPTMIKPLLPVVEEHHGDNTMLALFQTLFIPDYDCHPHPLFHICTATQILDATFSFAFSRK